MAGFLLPSLAMTRFSLHNVSAAAVRSLSPCGRGLRRGVLFPVTPLPETSLRFVSDLSHKGRGEECVSRADSNFKEPT